MNNRCIMNLKHGDERLKERCVFDRFCFKISLYLEKKNKVFFIFFITDYVDQRLYWIDAKLHKIGSMTLNGSDVRYVYEDAREIQRPFAIAVFEDSLYWTDWSTNAIKSVDKWTGFNPKTLNIGAYSVMDIKVYHKLRQNTSKYP